MPQLRADVKKPRGPAAVSKERAPTTVPGKGKHRRTFPVGSLTDSLAWSAFLEPSFACVAKTFLERRTTKFFAILMWNVRNPVYQKHHHFACTSTCLPSYYASLTTPVDG